MAVKMDLVILTIQGVRHKLASLNRCLGSQSLFQMKGSSKEIKVTFPVLAAISAAVFQNGRRSCNRGTVSQISIHGVISLISLYWLTSICILISTSYRQHVRLPQLHKGN